jgi:capsule assembly protein Wzi
MVSFPATPFCPVIGRLAGLAAVISLCLPDTAGAQASPIIPLTDPVYQSIRSLQLRGLLTGLHPSALPYTYAEVAANLDKETREVSERAPSVQALVTYVRDTVTPFVGNGPMGFTVQGGVRASSNGRLDPLRVLSGGDGLYPFLAGGLHWTEGPVIARAAFRGDLYWDSDPDGLDAVGRAYLRNDESYAGIMTPGASLLVGRVATQWGPSAGSGLLLSDNARSFDAIHLRLGSGSVSLRSVVGELDSITGDGRFSGTAGDDSVASGSERRWMMAHRLDWKPSPRLVISFMEAALFSGASSGLSLKYLNPAQLLVLAVDNRPKNTENNGLLALGLWAQLAGWTIQSQILVDDFDVVFGDEPGSFATTLSLDRALRPNLDFRSHLEVVASRTYNTFQPEGRWTYLNRGLATQFSDYVVTSAALVWYGKTGHLRLEPYLIGLWQGERDIRDPYRSDDTFGTILVGTVERTARLALAVHYQVAGRAYASLDAGVNVQQNVDHVPGRSRVRGVVTAAFGIRWDAPRRDSGGH